MISKYDHSTLRYDLTSPCDDCPFKRTSTHPYTLNAVVDYLTNVALERSVGHTCHKTDARSDCQSAQGYNGPIQHCAGALIMLRKAVIAGHLIMPDYLAAALFSEDWDFRKMDMDADVYDFREMAFKILKEHGVDGG